MYFYDINRRCDPVSNILDRCRAYHWRIVVGNGQAFRKLSSVSRNDILRKLEMLSDIMMYFTQHVRSKNLFLD
jgi:hypothetical protein